MKCPECGVEPYPGADLRCSACGHTEVRRLGFEREDGQVMPVGVVGLTLNQRWARSWLGDEARFWADGGQCVVKRHGTEWRVTHVSGAANETLLDGKAITEATLSEGMVLSVGREATGASKTPLKVRLM